MTNTGISEYEEKRAIEIKHRGQCPHPKGHASADIVFAVITTMMITFVGTLVLLSIPDGVAELRRQAIALGYAVYDQKDGHWHWVQR